jgi:hypothetical protein
MGKTKIPVSPEVRKYFAALGAIGGKRGSKADKSRAGKLGRAAMVAKAVAEHLKALKH